MSRPHRKPSFVVLPGVAPADRPMSAYRGRIIGAASLAPAGASFISGLPCRRRPKNHTCPGWLEIVRQEGPSSVRWSCPKCGDGGEIVDWEGGPFDLTSEREVRDPVKLRLDADMQRFGLRLTDCEDRALFLRSRRRSRDLLAQVPSRDLEEFTERVARECRAPHKSSKRRQFEELQRVLDTALGRAPVFGMGDLLTLLTNPALDVPASRRPRTAKRRGKVRPVRVKASLRQIRPPIWRRLVLPGELTLAELHELLQTAFGWYDGHLHHFRDAEERYFGDPETLDRDMEDERDVRVADVLFRKGQRLLYEYDFGDGWEHELVVEELLDVGEPAPRCLAGRRAGPPEDCGGPWGYADLVAALEDPRHERHGELNEWYPHFAPNEFDVAELDQELRGRFGH